MNAEARTARAKPWRVYAMLALVMLFWAGNSIIARALHEEVPPFTLALMRWAGALALVAPFAWRHVVADWAEAKRGWGAIVLLALLGVSAFNALLYAGLAHTTATNALLIQAGIPALVLAFGFLIFRDKPSRAQLAGVSLAALGVLAIIFKGDAAALASLRFGLGDVLIFAAVLAWALYTVLLRIAPKLHPLSFLALTFAIGVITMAPPAWIELQTRAVELSPAVWGAGLYVALLPSLAAYWLYNKAVAEIGAADAGQTIALLPLFGAFLAALTLHEPLYGYHWIGMALIAAGIALPALTPALMKARAP